ncbi:prepilin peptidase [Microbacterium sp. ZW T5_56]|uniref:prepilin peptidase n=1 Tax=Microbacterium sp. ZW T5_56 TaxID=3378081 RepID=UPI00385185D1
MAGTQKRTRPRPIVVISTVLFSVGALLVAVDATFRDRLPLPGSPLVSVAALLVFASAGAAFTVIDITEHRLPNTLMLPSFAALSACVLIGWLEDGTGAAALRAGVGALVSFLAFLVLAVLHPGGMGGGDVKLAGLLGGLTAWASWPSLAICFAAAFLSAGVFALAGLSLGRLRTSQAVPFGPFLVLGGWCGLLLS